MLYSVVQIIEGPERNGKLIQFEMPFVTFLHFLANRMWICSFWLTETFCFEVKSLMAKIEGDQRHREISILKDERIAERSYAEGMILADKGVMSGVLQKMGVKLILNKNNRGFELELEYIRSEKTNTKDLWQLIYTSVLRARGTSISVRKSMAQILKQAQRNNAKLNISGAISYSPQTRQVLQLLEGPRPIVCSVFESIELDCRHKEVRCLYSEPAAERLYSDFGTY